MIEPITFPAARTGSHDAGENKLKTLAVGTTISKTVNNGIVTVSGNTQTIQLVHSAGGVRSSTTQAFTYNLYMVSDPTMSNATNLGAVTSYNASGVPGFEKLTVDNFVMELISLPSAGTGYYKGNKQSYMPGTTVTKSYDSTTGQFTISTASQPVYLTYPSESNPVMSATQNFNYRVWLVK